MAGITITIPLGQEVTPLPEGSEYLGFIFARGDTPGAVERALKRAFARIEFAVSEDQACVGSTA